MIKYAYDHLGHDLEAVFDSINEQGHISIAELNLAKGIVTGQYVAGKKKKAKFCWTSQQSHWLFVNDGVISIASPSTFTLNPKANDPIPDIPLFATSNAQVKRLFKTRAHANVIIVKSSTFEEMVALIQASFVDFFDVLDSGACESD